MELKDAFIASDCSNIHMNPFNGIERGYFELAWGHPEPLNPFNGIERGQPAVYSVLQGSAESIQWN